MNSSDSSLKRAYGLFQEVAEEGFDWESPFAAARKVKEELEEVIVELHKENTLARQMALKEEVGDLFLACTCLALHCGLDPEEAIDLGLKKFLKRYKHFKAYVRKEGISLQEISQDELTTLWRKLKK